MKKFIFKRNLGKAYKDMQLIVHRYIEHIEYLDFVIKRQETEIERISKENEQLKNENMVLRHKRLSEPMLLGDLMSRVDFLKVKKATDDYGDIGVIKVRKIR